MTIAMAASELFPYVKSGGLADAVGGLCKELSRYETTIAVIPLYRSIDRVRFGIKPTEIAFTLELGKKAYDIKIYHAVFEGMETYFIYHPILCDSDTLYESSDNDLRFGVFAHALCVLAADHLSIDVLHLHDWQSALAAPLAKAVYKLECRVVLSIHNLAFQGVFAKEAVERLNLGWELFTMERLEFYDQVNFLKGGIAYADAVSTVSPSYALEIVSAEYGAQLEGFLLHHQEKLSGILNGIDTVEFDPSHDPSLGHPFDARHLDNKRRQKEALCDELSLSDSRRPLLAYVGRLAEQKGIRELVEVIRAVQDAPLNIVILGSGEGIYESLCKTLQRYENVKIILKYDEALSRRIYAASDFFLMPSTFEPCGLAQMIAMRYGSIPIVRRTGGLKDTVADFCDLEGRAPSEYAGIGIGMEACDVETFMHALIKALSLYGNEAMMREFIVYNMNKDFSWHRPALAYLALYRSLNP
ncbi:MAG: glycogen synthase [Campylobacterales bacterium]|nr:glycogen synthase [Campylobacterales bacterium]